MKLLDFDADTIHELLTDLKNEATQFVRSCDADVSIQCEFKVYMRYTGQGWWIPVILNAEQAMNPDGRTFQDLFEKYYTNLFGGTVDGMDVEMTVWAVNATTPSQQLERIILLSESSQSQVILSRTIFDPAVGESLDSSIVFRDNLKPGESLAGPAAIIEDETTIILPSSRFAIRQSDGCIDITRRVQENYHVNKNHSRF